MKLDRRAAWLTAAYMVGYIIGVAIAINLLTQVPDMAVVTTSDAYAHLNIGLAVLVALMFATLAAIFFYLGEVARHQKAPPSALYAPLLIQSLALFTIFGLAALSGLAREHDGLRTPLGAAWIRTPAVMLVTVVLFYSCLITSGAWFVAILLKTQGLRRQRVTLLYVEVIVFAASLVVAAAWL